VSAQFIGQSKLMPPSPTIRELAKACGLSRSTVSAVLRNQPGFADSTRKRVQETARTLGYRPDPRVRELTEYLSTKKRRGEAVPLLWLHGEEGKNDWENLPWLRHFFAGARAGAAAQGYRLDPYWVREPGLSPESIRREWDTRGIRGCVVGKTASFLTVPQEMLTHRAVVQVHGAPEPERPYHRVHADFAGNLRLAMHELLACGFSRVLLCHQEGVLKETVGAYGAAYRQVCAENGIPSTEPLVYHAQAVSTGEVRRRLSSVYESFRPQALLCSDRRIREWLPPGAEVTLVHLNLAEDVSGWWGIDPRHEDIGRAAVDLLIGQLQRNETGEVSIPLEVLVPGRWVGE